MLSHPDYVLDVIRAAAGGVVIMKATSTSPTSGQRTASSDTGVLMQGHQLERNLGPGGHSRGGTGQKAPAA